ncbi:MAG: 2-C-methyl-D-erythritol 2,4-cyclodiphosphate synthase [bacterium]
MDDLRIGSGWDVHRIVPERALVLGGVTIPWDRGLLGHSDADVVLHAVLDAVLGALALGDIGQWFPDTDPAFKGIASTKLVEQVMRSPQLTGWTVVNLDVTLLAQAPQIAPWREPIRASLATRFGVPVERVSVKATTTERLGLVGREEGMAAQAVVLMARQAGME